MLPSSSCLSVIGFPGAGPDGGVEEAPTDRALVERALAGDHDSYAILVRRHQDRLYRHALGMVLDPDAAADLVQDALVRAYGKLGKCRDRSSFGTWLFRILRNRCLDHLRERRRRDLPLDEHPDLPVAGGGPEADFERRALGDVLERTLEQLPAAQREAFLLKHVQDLTYEEMAEVTGASLSALRMRVLRAREMLQVLLADEVDASGRRM
jgi:RNA polymerase sigma-70 factor, ECF subfamily